jgi:hypothetical protein
MKSFLKQALVGAALAFTLIPTLLVLKVALFQKSPHMPLSEGLGSIYALYGSLSLAVFVVVGLPLLAVFRRRRWRSPLAFSLGGLVVALIGEAVIVGGRIVDFRDTWTSSSITGDTITLAASGLIAGAAFWLLMRREILRGA